MLKVDAQALQKVVSNLQAELKDGLLNTDIVDRQSGLSLAGYQSVASASALFNILTTEIADTLRDSKFPPLKHYYILDLNNGETAVVICHGEDLLQTILVDSSKVNLGLLFSIVLPECIEGVKLAHKK